MDIVTKEVRSRMMANIRGSGNRSTELKMISIFRKEKITGWRRNIQIFGKPDFVFQKQRLAVFVDGCFWHGCQCAKIPHQNREFWLKKIESNKKRDMLVTRYLRTNGWNVLRIPECKMHLEAEIVLKLKHFLEK